MSHASSSSYEKQKALASLKVLGVKPIFEVLLTPFALLAVLDFWVSCVHSTSPSSPIQVSYLHNKGLGLDRLGGTASIKGHLLVSCS